MPAPEAHSIKLRNIEPKVIEAGTAQDLEANLADFLAAGEERVLVGAYQVGELALLILYAE